MNNKRPHLLLAKAVTVTIEHKWQGWREQSNNPLILIASPRAAFPYDKDEFQEWLAKHNCKKVGTYHKVLFPSEIIKRWFLLRWP